MSRAQDLVRELETTTASYDAIFEEFKDKKASEIPADKATQLEQLAVKGASLQTEIAAEQKLEKQRDGMSKLQKFLEEPVSKVPQPSAINADKDGRKALEAQGFEFKNGTVYKNTSLGTKVAMFGEDVLFGDIPKQASEADFFIKTRASTQPGYRPTYVKWFKTAIATGNPAMAWSQLTGAEQKALSEGTDAAGGVLVPVDLQAEILARTAQTSIMRRYATVQATSRDYLRYPLANAASATAGGLASGGGSVFSSAFVGAWVGEVPSQSDIDPSFGFFDVQIRKVRAITKLSNDFVSDAATDIVAWLGQNGAENIALVQDLGFIAGTGAANQPLGILNSGAATVDVEGSTSNTISNTTSSTGTVPKLWDLLFAVPPQYRAKRASCAFLMTPTSDGKTRKLVDANGRYMFPFEASLGSGLGSGGVLLSYPVEDTPFMQEDGTDANKVYLFGDLSAYIIAERSQITTRVLNERYADTDQIGVILFSRVGGGTWNTDAIRFGIV